MGFIPDCFPASHTVSPIMLCSFVAFPKHTTALCLNVSSHNRIIPPWQAEFGSESRTVVPTSSPITPLTIYEIPASTESVSWRTKLRSSASASVSTLESSVTVNPLLISETHREL